MSTSTRTTTHRVLVTGGIAAALLLVSACGSGEDHGSMSGMGGSSMMSSGSATSAAAMTDVMFAQMMIPHHQQAIDMADLALEDASGASPEVRSMAEQIAKAQAPEIALMQGWLESWGASSGMPTGHDMTGMMSDADMSELEQATGREFDRAWLTMMIQHHEGAITMAEGVMRTTDNADVEKLATAIVESQQREIVTMKGLLA